MWPNAAETEELLLNAREGDRDAVDRLMERREIGRRIATPRIVPPAHEVDRDVLVALRIGQDVVLCPKGIIRTVPHGFDEPVLVFRRKLQRCRSIAQRQMLEIIEIFREYEKSLIYTNLRSRQSNCPYL